MNGSDTFLLRVLEWLAAGFIVLLARGVLIVAVLYVVDITQTRHAVRRNYPVIGRFRYLFERLGEFFRQCFSARGFMFALGCIQALQCNRNTCPTGVTTHDPGG